MRMTSKWISRRTLKMKFCSKPSQLQRFKVLRTGFLVRVLAVICCLVVLTMLTPPVRNALIPMWPGLWRGLSVAEVFKIKLVTLTSNKKAALSSCREPNFAKSINIASVNINIHHLVTGFIRQHERWLNSSPEKKTKLSPFLPLMNPFEKARLLETWQVLHEALRRYDIPYYMLAGSLLGAIRHKGVIPWDDDIDIAVPVRNKETIQNVLSCIPGYTLRVQSNLHWKFFASNASIVKSVEPFVKTLHAKPFSKMHKSDAVLQYEPENTVVMRYPFVDIFMMTDDGSHLTWTLTGHALHTAIFLLDDVYPLAFVPFESFVAPVPRRSRHLLKLQYDTSQCISPAHNHKLGVGIYNYTTISCSELADMYPIYII